MPALISTMGPSSAPLLDHNFNVQYRPHDDRILKYPPGLHSAASASSPSLLLPSPPKSPARRRSGSFTYTSGSSYASGNAFHPLPHDPSSPPSRLGKRSAMAAGLGGSQRSYSGSFTSESASYDLPPPPRSPKGSRFFEMTPRSSNFDPFGPDTDDEDMSLPPASSTSYSHYWQYDPSTKGPKLCSTPPPVKSLLASPRPATIKLPPLNSLPLSADPPTVTSPPPASRSFANGTTIRSLAPLSVPDKNARSRLLAGILLNRIYAVGKPMRRRCDETSKEYVKSGLSRVVTFDTSY